MNIELLKHANEYIGKMANGINPLTNEKLPNNDIVNNIRISRCLFYVNSILKEVEKNGGINKKKGTLPFQINKETLKKYELTEDELSISKICKKINELKPNEDMKNIKPVDMTNWLVSLGLLKIIESNNKTTKIPTTEGERMGIRLKHIVLSYTEYDLVVYSKTMQEFILDNFDDFQKFTSIN